MLSGEHRNAGMHGIIRMTTSRSAFAGLVFIAVMLTQPLLARADLKDDVIGRCRKQMGEYGAAMVKACVDQDLAAARSSRQVSRRRNADCRALHQPDARTRLVHGEGMRRPRYGGVRRALQIPEGVRSNNCALPETDGGVRCVNGQACADQDIEAEEALRKY